MSSEGEAAAGRCPHLTSQDFPLPSRRELTHYPIYYVVYSNGSVDSKNIAPYYEELSQLISKPKATLVKINTDAQRPLAAEFAVTTPPTFILFRDGAIAEKVKGANPHGLLSLVEKLSKDVESGGEGSIRSGSGGLAWRGADLPRGYTDISDAVDVRGLELLNADTDFSVRTLFNKSKPSALNKSPSTTDEKDWVESDTDEQLLLFAPFNSATKLHTLQVCVALCMASIYNNKLSQASG